MIIPVSTLVKNNIMRLRLKRIKKCKISNDFAYIYEWNKYKITVRFKNKRFIPKRIIMVNADIFNKNKVAGIYINKYFNNYFEGDGMLCVKFDSLDGVKPYEEWITNEELKNNFTPL